jgi:predicted ATP-dependent protease
MHLKTVLIPRRNYKDLADVPRNVQRDLNLMLVDRMEEILARALIPDTLPPVKVRPRHPTHRKSLRELPQRQPLEPAEAPGIASGAIAARR